ncbi:hypothetical protein IKW75_02395 [Candidatus Saccharibacteria bacterium]|nr:hypothetical protein [Candidatus Saccharibacteria bacterium]
MLINANDLLNKPILSLHMGGMIAKTSEIIVDPDNLKVVAFKVYGPEVGGEFGEYLQEKDVREYSPLGMVIDSIDEFVNETDVVKLEKVLKLNFSLNGMKVVTKKGTKLGKVSGYTINTDNFMVQQLIVQRPILKAFVDPELIIGRSEVVKITDTEIVVKDEESKIRANATHEDFIPNFVNPFREQRLSTADSQTLDE